MRKKKFENKEDALVFAKEVGGKLNDLTNIKTAKSNYSVSFGKPKDIKNKEVIIKTSLGNFKGSTNNLEDNLRIATDKLKKHLVKFNKNLTKTK